MTCHPTRSDLGDGQLFVESFFVIIELLRDKLVPVADPMRHLVCSVLAVSWIVKVSVPACMRQTPVQCTFSICSLALAIQSSGAPLVFFSLQL
jgi:hypothetical protein